MNNIIIIRYVDIASTNQYIAVFFRKCIFRTREKIVSPNIQSFASLNLRKSGVAGN